MDFTQIELKKIERRVNLCDLRALYGKMDTKIIIYIKKSFYFYLYYLNSIKTKQNMFGIIN